MKTYKILCVAVLALFFAVVAQAEEKESKLTYAEQVEAREASFLKARADGKTITVVIIEGNSLFNGTTHPVDLVKDGKKPYSKDELLAAKISAERDSQVFLLAKDGTLYFPTVKKGQSISESSNAPRIHRVLSEKQKGEKMFTWSTLVPLVGREVELSGEIYPGYAGVKGISIEAIFFEGEYLVGE
jgi:hypothetical protein